MDSQQLSSLSLFRSYIVTPAVKSLNLFLSSCCSSFLLSILQHLTAELQNSNNPKSLSCYPSSLQSSSSSLHKIHKRLEKERRKRCRHKKIKPKESNRKGTSLRSSSLDNPAVIFSRWQTRVRDWWISVQNSWSLDQQTRHFQEDVDAVEGIV